MKCPHCGSEPSASPELPEMAPEMGDESSAKSDVLDELLALMEERVANRLPKQPPAKEVI